jgi:hypothetical protein
LRAAQLVEGAGFGHEMKLDRVESGHASYCAKYGLPWLHRVTAAIVKGNGRLMSLGAQFSAS